MEDAVNVIRGRYHFPLHAEFWGPDPRKDAITCQEYLKSSQGRDQEAFTEIERKKLQSAQALAKESPSHLSRVIDYKIPRFDIVLPPKLENPDALLNELVRLDPHYVWEKTNTSYILRLKGKTPFPEVKSFKLENTTVQKAWKVLDAQVLQPSDLGFTFVNSTDYPFAEDTKKRINLKLENVSFYICLTRFTESLGTNIYWEVGGPQGFRSVGFGSVERDIELDQTLMPDRKN